MRVDEETFETPAYAVEHILDVPGYKKLVSGFTVGNDAAGLEAYLKYAAIGDEKATLRGRIWSSTRPLVNLPVISLCGLV